MQGDHFINLQAAWHCRALSAMNISDALFLCISNMMAMMPLFWMTWTWVAKTVSFVLTCAVLKLQFFGTRRDVMTLKLLKLLKLLKCSRSSRATAQAELRDICERIDVGHLSFGKDLKGRPTCVAADCWKYLVSSSSTPVSFFSTHT